MSRRTRTGNQPWDELLAKLQDALRRISELEHEVAGLSQENNIRQLFRRVSMLEEDKQKN